MCGVTAYGADAARAIEAYFGRVSIVVDGMPLEDETLLYEGVTYVPIAAVAKALGKEVSYNEATRTGYIGEGAAAAPMAAAPTREPESVVATQKVNVDNTVHQEDSRTAYWVENGKSYHFSENCRTLARSRNIFTGTLAEALAAGKTDPCDVCAGGV